MSGAELPVCSRRRFLGLAGRSVVGGLMLPAAVACSTDVGEPRTLSFTVSQFPHLALTGGLVVAQVDELKLLLIRSSAQEVVALDSRCTHVLCDLSPDVYGKWDGTVLTCTCHGSQFDAQGNAMTPPALLPLGRYPVTFDPVSGQGSVDLEHPLVAPP